MTPRTRRKLAWLAISGLVVALVAAAGVMVAATHYGRSLSDEESADQIWRKVEWRLKLYALKATGGVPDFSWNELIQMTRQQGGFGLEGISDGLSWEGSVTNDYVTPDDLKAGEVVFREHCSVCHGGGGTGGHGPALNRAGLKHGDSDLAIYKVVRDGVPDTSMAPVPLGFKERWQVVGYVRSLGLKNPYPGNETAPLDIRVSAEQVLAAGKKADEWLTFSGSLDGRRYSPLTELTPANVSQLQLRWVHQTEGRGPKVEATPLVVNGVIFTTEPPSTVVALDA